MFLCYFLDILGILGLCMQNEEMRLERKCQTFGYRKILLSLLLMLQIPSRLVLKTRRYEVVFLS